MPVPSSAICAPSPATALADHCGAGADGSDVGAALGVEIAVAEQRSETALQLVTEDLVGDEFLDAGHVGKVFAGLSNAELHLGRFRKADELEARSGKIIRLIGSFAERPCW